MQRQTGLKFVLILMALIAAGTYTGWNFKQLLISPLDMSAPLRNISETAADTKGNLYVIADTKQKIYGLGKDGKLRYAIEQPADPDGNILNFTDIAVDDEQRLYVLNTKLDSYGMYVLSEQVLRYTPDGKLDRTLLDWTEDQQRKRIGQLKDLRVEDGSLTLFVDGTQHILQKSMSLNSLKWSDSFGFILPENRYLSEVSGAAPGEIYYTTRRGSIYKVTDRGESLRIFPTEASEALRQSVPERPALNADGNLYFVDRSEGSIKESGATGGNAAIGWVQTSLSKTDLEKDAGEPESSEVVALNPGADGGLIVTLTDEVLHFQKDFGAYKSYSKASLKTTALLFRWSVWAAAALTLVLVVLLLRMIFIHIMRRRVSFFLKQLAVFVPLVVICMVVLSNFIYDSFSQRMKEEMQRELKILAQNGKNVVDGNALERLNSPVDFMNKDYQSIQKSMSFLYEGNLEERAGLYSTLYKYADDKLYLIMDDDDSVNMFTPFPLDDENKRVLENGEVRGGSWTDSNGDWLFAMGPVYDSTGKVTGIYEVGRDMNVIYQSNETIYKNIIKQILFISLIILTAFAISAFVLLSSLRKLRKGAAAIAKGNWDTEVHIRTHDEVADLGEQFNLMARHIRQYIKDITSFSEASYRFVPQEFFSYLGKKDILDIHLGDQVQRNMVVMVSKIRAFDRISKRLTPKENFNFMNAFLSYFGPVVRSQNGLISNYTGAGFMSLFPRRPADAIKAAIAMRKELNTYNAGLSSQGMQPIDIGIAIHKGPMMLGIIGEESRMEGNVISDDVILANLLEQMSESLGVSVLVTKAVMDSLDQRPGFRYRSLGRVNLEGKEEPVELFDVYEGEPDVAAGLKERTKELFEQGIQLYQEGRFFDAREAFVEVIKWNRSDLTAKLYFYLCDEYYQRGTAAEWNGTLAVS